MEELKFSDLLYLYKSKKKFIICFVAVVTSLAMVYSFFIPHKYTAYATILPQMKSDRSNNLSSFLQSFGGGGMLMGGMGGDGSQSYTFAEILQSRTVSEFTVDKLQLLKNPSFPYSKRSEMINIIKSSIDVEIVKGGILKISASFSTPWFPSSSDSRKVSELTAQICNTVIEGLDNTLRKKNISSAKYSGIYIRTELERYSKKLDSLEKELELFQSRNKILSIDDQTQALLNQAVTIGTELTRAEIDLNLARQEYSSNSPTVAAFSKTVDFLRSQYDKIQKGGIVVKDAFSIPLADIPKIIRIYSDLVRDKKILEQVIIYLETQRHQEAIQEQKDIPIIEMLDKAIPPDTRQAPSRKLMLLLSLVISTFFAFLIVTIKTFFKTKA